MTTSVALDVLSGEPDYCTGRRRRGPPAVDRVAIAALTSRLDETTGGRVRALRGARSRNW